MFVISSPSGAGKTTLGKCLLQDDDNLTLSISVTTRLPRETEIDGVDYHFMSEKQFVEQREAGMFLESAKVFDHYYATPIVETEELLSSGRDILFDIDWQGTQQLRVAAHTDIVSIFILPPSMEELCKRLQAREKDHDFVDHRMKKAAEEISHYMEYDYVIINDDIEKSVETLKVILSSERLKYSRQKSLDEFVKNLLN